MEETLQKIEPFLCFPLSLSLSLSLSLWLWLMVTRYWGRILQLHHFLVDDDDDGSEEACDYLDHRERERERVHVPFDGHCCLPIADERDSERERKRTLTPFIFHTRFLSSSCDGSLGILRVSL
ncbi:hypothetical protein I3842_07G049800 [Carya illinoinensis]|uniref:Uncharacterized protein n=1 Tax=Carya illinoinensis TaxID=32201 RepID=A0A922EGA3_CARIL|nr:hypothetical protein I3842_07G049800 [Carya illinoinensis]